MSFVVTNTAGAGTITTSGINVTGVSTVFTTFTQCQVGGVITVSGQTRTIATITSNTTLTVTTAFSPDITTGTAYTCSCTITQSGTDTSLAGLAGLGGVTYVTLAGGLTWYITGGMRFIINGTLTIGGAAATEREILVFGTDSVIANQAWINVPSGGSLTVGYTQTYNSATDTTQPITLMYQVGSGKGYVESQAISMNVGASASTLLVQNGAAFNHKSGTIDMWGGVGFGASSTINIGVAGCRAKPVWDFTRTFRTGSGTTNPDQVIYCYSTSLSINGFIFIGANNRSASQYGASFGFLAPPLVCDGYEPRYLATASTGSSSKVSGTFTFKNYSGAYGSACDAYFKTGGISHEIFLNALNGSSFTRTGDGSNDDVTTQQNLTTKVATPAGVPIVGAVCMLMDTLSVFYSAVSDGSGNASFTNVTTGYGAPINTGTPTAITQYFSATDVTTQYIKMYGYLPFTNSVTLRGIGGTSSGAAMSADVGNTLSAAAALTLLGTNFSVSSTGVGTITITASSTFDQVYDAISAWNTQNVQAQVTFPTKSTSPITWSGTALSTAMNIIVNTGVVLSPGTKFKTLTTTGTLTLTGTLGVGAVVTSPAGTNGWITVQGQTSGSSLLALDTTSTQQFNGTVTASQSLYVPAGVTGSWTGTVALYGKQDVTWTQLVTSGGLFTVNVVQIPDANITQPTVATVAAYTSLNDPQQLYDYIAYYKTTTAGILYPRLATKSAAQLVLGSANVVEDASAGSVFTWVNGTSTMTFKSSSLDTSSTMTSVATTGSWTYNNGAVAVIPITSSAGTTGVFTVSGIIAGSSIAFYNNSAVQQSYVASTGTSQTFYISAGATGTWSYTLALYGKQVVTGTIGVAGGGYLASSVAQIPDTAITQPTQATVAAYTTLATPEQLYDYAAYWKTTAAGIGFAQLVTKVASSAQLGSVNVVQASTGAVWSYVSGTNTLTIDSPTMSTGSVLTSIATSGTWTYSGSTATIPITSSAGTTGVFTLGGLIAGSQVLWQDNSLAVQSNVTAAGTSQTFYIAAGATGSWTFTVCLYGKQDTGGTINVAGGGYLATSVAQIPDTGITQPSSAVVAAYTTCSSPDQAYDLAALYKATAAGIIYPRLATKSGPLCSFGSLKGVINAAAGSPFAYNGTDTITLKATTFVPGTNMLAISWTGAVMVLTGATITAQYTDSAGVSNPVYINSLTSTYVSLNNSAGAQIQYVGPTSSTFFYHIPSGATSPWSVILRRPGYAPTTISIALDGTVHQITGTLIQRTDLGGNPVYTGSSTSLLTISLNSPSAGQVRIDTGNGVATAQQAYDMVETALCTATGILIPVDEILLPTALGFVFYRLSTNLQVRRRLSTDVNATILGIVSQDSGTVVDGSNGSVQITGTNASITMQNIRDALALAISAGVTPVAGSVDTQLGNIQTTVTPLLSTL